MRLRQIGPDQKILAVRQLDVGDLKLGALATQNGKILAPIKLEGLAWAKRQGHEGAAPCRLLLPLPINPPVTRQSREPPDLSATASAFAAVCTTCPPPSSANRQASQRKDQAYFDALGS